MHYLPLSLMLSSMVLLSACGQSGALQLASDPNYDQRAKYLLYPNPLQKQPDVSKTKEQQPTTSALP